MAGECTEKTLHEELARAGEGRLSRVGRRSYYVMPSCIKH